MWLRGVSLENTQRGKKKYLPVQYTIIRTFILQDSKVQMKTGTDSVGKLYKHKLSRIQICISIFSLHLKSILTTRGKIKI